MSDIRVTCDGDTRWLECIPGNANSVLIRAIEPGDSWEELAAEVAGHQAQHGCAASGPAKVIVVTDDMGRERRYTAPDFGMLNDGTLIIGTRTADGIDGVTGAGIDKLTVAAGHAPGHWKRVHKDGAQLDDVRRKAVRMQSALQKITMADVTDSPETDMLREVARACLEDIGWDEEDL